MPSDSLESNWAYLVIAAQAWNLKAWLGLVQSDKTMGQRILKMEYRRFLRRLVQIPCQILQRGRTSSLPAAERQRLDRNAAERSAVAQAGPLRLTRPQGQSKENPRRFKG